MCENPQISLRPVCPDDLSALKLTGDIASCLTCGREFAINSEVLEFLPKAVYAHSSIQNRLLNAYCKTFSERRETLWHKPIRESLNRLGNAYLYSWAARTIEEAANGQSLSILDAGCGEGMLRRYISDRFEYVGIDFSIRPLRRAQRHYPATYFRADLNHLPFPAATFDMAVSLQSLQ